MRNTYARIDAPLDEHYFTAVNKMPAHPPDTDMMVHGPNADGDDDDEAEIPDRTVMPFTRTLHLTIQHDPSSDVPDGTLFFAADETPTGLGRLYKGYLRTYPAKRGLRRGRMLLEFEDPIMIVGYGYEGVVKGSMKRSIIGAVMPFHIGLMRKSERQRSLRSTIRRTFWPIRNNEDSTSDIALNHDCKRGGDAGTSAPATSARR